MEEIDPRTRQMSGLYSDMSWSLSFVQTFRECQPWVASLRGNKGWCILKINTRFSDHPWLLEFNCLVCLGCYYKMWNTWWHIGNLSLKVLEERKLRIKVLVLFCMFDDWQGIAFGFHLLLGFPCRRCLVSLAPSEETEPTYVIPYFWLVTS